MAVFLMPSASPLAQTVDLNGNGVSDIWEIQFGASDVNVNADADADSMSNELESTAGTDPFDSNSVLRVMSFLYSGTNLDLTITAIPGKLYQWQSIETADIATSSNWVTEATILASNTSVFLTAPLSAPAKFFRVLVTDVDSDGDGVSDCEELQIGLDPHNPNSNAQLDARAQPIGDYAFVTNNLAAQNVVSIKAPNPTATQPDPSQSPNETGAFAITRGGFPLDSILVNLSVPEPGVGVAVEGLDFEPLPRSIAFAKGVTAQTIVLKPYTNTSLLNPVLATLMLQPGPNYTIGPVSNASVVIYPSTTPSGTGLTGDYYRGSSSTYSSSTNFNPTNLVLTRLDQVVDFTWSTNTAPITNNSYWTVRWTGQVQPEFSETYTFVANTDDGVKLWVNDQLIIDKWVSESLTEWSGSIDLLGDVRYNIRMEYFTAGSALPQAHLAWYSPSQVKQVIPAARLYPATASAAPSAVTSPMTAVSFVGQPFSYTIQGANSPTFFSASGLPPGLTFNSTNGLISGIPTLAGQFQVMLAVSNSLGLGSSVLILQVFDNASAVTREL